MTDINPATVRAVAASLTETHKRAIDELDDFYGRGPRHLSPVMNITVTEARSILQHFRSEGICDYGPLIDEDEGMMRGSGYWLGPFGMAVKREIGL